MRWHCFTAPTKSNRRFIAGGDWVGQIEPAVGGKGYVWTFSGVRGGTPESRGEGNTRNKKCQWRQLSTRLRVFLIEYTWPFTVYSVDHGLRRNLGGRRGEARVQVIKNRPGRSCKPYYNRPSCVSSLSYYSTLSGIAIGGLGTRDYQKSSPEGAGINGVNLCQGKQASGKQRNSQDIYTTIV